MVDWKIERQKRAVKLLIARRAFLLLTFFHATLHACISACDSIFLKFHRITVHFYDISFSHRTFLRMKNARPCDFCSRFIRGQPDLFALCSRLGKFVRAPFRLIHSAVPSSTSYAFWSQDFFVYHFSQNTVRLIFCERAQFLNFHIRDPLITS